MVIQVDKTKGAPSLATILFQEIRMITGTRSTRITERRLRHWVVKSERSRETSAVLVVGNAFSIVKYL